MKPFVQHLGLIVILSFCLGGTAPVLGQSAIPLYGFKVINIYPHDPKAFTQGLIHKDGFLFESTGRYNESSIRKVDIKTGKVIQIQNLPSTIFGEGLTDWGNQLISLTWKRQMGFVWNFKTLKPERSFQYIGEGWGITHNDTHLIMSNGTPTLKFLDPETLTPINEIYVTLNGKPITNINELEWVNGEIFANVWQKDFILRINPDTGKVIGIIDLTGLLKANNGPDNVLNGIAVDPEGRLFVTGKLWPKLFEIEIVKK